MKGILILLSFVVLSWQQNNNYGNADDNMNQLGIPFNWFIDPSDESNTAIEQIPVRDMPQKFEDGPEPIINFQLPRPGVKNADSNANVYVPLAALPKDPASVPKVFDKVPVPIIGSLLDAALKKYLVDHPPPFLPPVQPNDGTKGTESELIIQRPDYFPNRFDFFQFPTEVVTVFDSEDSTTLEVERDAMGPYETMGQLVISSVSQSKIDTLSKRSIINSLEKRSPPVLDGYTITYYDPNGNVIPDPNTNNTYTDLPPIMPPILTNPILQPEEDSGIGEIIWNIPAYLNHSVQEKIVLIQDEVYDHETEFRTDSEINDLLEILNQKTDQMNIFIPHVRPFMEAYKPHGDYPDSGTESENIEIDVVKINGPLGLAEIYDILIGGGDDTDDTVYCSQDCGNFDQGIDNGSHNPNSTDFWTHDHSNNGNGNPPNHGTYVPPYVPRTTTIATPTPTSSNNSTGGKTYGNDSSSNSGPIIGGVLGGCAAAGCAAGAFVYFRRKKNAPTVINDEENTMEAGSNPLYETA